MGHPQNSRQYARTLKAAGQLSKVELARLGAWVAKQLETLDLDPYRQGYEDGYKNVADQYQNIVNRHIQAVYYEIGQVNATIMYLFGIVTAGFGDLPKEQIKLIAGDMVKVANSLDFELDRARKAGVEFSFADSALDDVNIIRKAAKAYYSDEDPNGDQLRDIIARRGSGPLVDQVINLRAQLAPGRRSGMSDVNRFLLERARHEREGGGVSWAKAANRIITDLSRKGDDLTAVEVEALDRLTGWKNAGQELRKLNRRDK